MSIFLDNAWHSVACKLYFYMCLFSNLTLLALFSLLNSHSNIDGRLTSSACYCLVLAQGCLDQQPVYHWTR